MAMNNEEKTLDKCRNVTIGEASLKDFTERELDILRELVTLASTAEIAERLGLSVDTVLGDIHEMLLKSGYNTRTRLVVDAACSGIVSREADNPKH